MEKNSDLTENIDNINEIILYQEQNIDEERIDNSTSQIELISDEEYLLECARYGDKDDMINLFEDNKGIDVNYKDSKDNTAVHMAAANGHLEIIKILFEKHKANVNIQNNSGNTPLRILIYNYRLGNY